MVSFGGQRCGLKRAELLQSALWYASHCGWPVFPCVSGAKEPLTNNGYKAASTDEATIRAWWAKWPNANVAIATGAAGLAVVDVDVKHGKRGLESWRDLRVELHLDDNTPTVETPSQGMHVYYGTNGHNVRCSAGKLGEGLDVRAQGGYVIVPPSLTPDGDYGWAFGCRPNERSLLPLPAPLAERLVEPDVGEREPRSPIARENLVAEVARAAAALPRLDVARADGYQTWLEVGLALSELGDAGLALWDGWSRHSAKYEPGACAGKWATFAPGNGLTLASLYAWAKEDAGNVSDEAPRYHLTDLGNAERFASAFGQDVRFCERLGGWHWWDGRRWVPDETGEVQRAAQSVARRLYDEAAKETDADRRAALAKWAIASESATRQAALLTLAWSQPGIAVRPDVFDTDPWLLNVNNGTVDLRTGDLRPHRREDLLTKLAPVDYDPKATAPTWQRHLERFLPDKDIRRQVQRDLALGLVGETLDEILPIWYGTGANGKSTTARALQEILGDYAQSAAPDLLVQTRHESHPTEIADLRGARSVFSIEIGDNRNLDEAKVKMLTGGDVKKARLMRQDFFEFNQTFTITLLCNHLPNIAGVDEAIWRRVRLIPWTVRIPEAKQLTQAAIVSTLASEGSGILHWLLQGLADWRKDRHWVADAVTKATSTYRTDQDRLGPFLADCYEQGPHYSVEVGAFYDAYGAWCDQNAQEAVGKIKAGQLLRGRGIVQRRPPGGKVRKWIGLRPRPPGAVTSCDDVSETPHESENPGGLEKLSQLVTNSGRPDLAAECCVCGAPVDHYGPSGEAWCTEHWPAELAAGLAIGTAGPGDDLRRWQ